MAKGMSVGPVSAPRSGASGAADTQALAETRAALEQGVRYHGWYLTEREHRNALAVLDALVARVEALEDALRREMQRNEGNETRLHDLAVMFNVPDGGRYINDWHERAAQFAKQTSSASEAPGVVREAGEAPADAGAGGDAE